MQTTIKGLAHKRTSRHFLPNSVLYYVHKFSDLSIGGGTTSHPPARPLDECSLLQIEEITIHMMSSYLGVHHTGNCNNSLAPFVGNFILRWGVEVTAPNLFNAALPMIVLKAEGRSTKKKSSP
jgi:hypothetical protein